MKINALLLAACCIAACSSGTTEYNPGTRNTTTSTIEGQWSWLLSEGGFRGGTQTPSTEGYSQTMILRSNNTYQLTRTPDSFQVSRSGWYRSGRQFYALVGDTVNVIAFLKDSTDPPETSWTRLQWQGTDTILIGESIADGIIETYIRKK